MEDNNNINLKTKIFKRRRNKSKKTKKIKKYFSKTVKIPILSPNNIKDIITDANLGVCEEDNFCVFKSINDNLLLIYKSYENFGVPSIIIYNIIDKKIMMKIKNPHKYSVGRFKYIFDELYQRDLLISYYDLNIKLWNLNTMETLFNFEGYREIQTACFLNENKIIYVSIKLENSSINIFDLEGNCIKKINGSNDDPVYYSDSFYDIELKKNFIITGNKGYTKSYDYTKGELYHIYMDNEKENEFYLGRPKVVINKKRKYIELIESCWDGYIRIWNFHSAILLKKIKVCTDKRLSSIYLWNNKYLFVGSEDRMIRLIDLKNGKIVQELKNEDEGAFTLRKIFIPNYGNCLLSQGYNSKIIIYSI